MDNRVREWLVVRTRNTQCKDKRMSILAFFDVILDDFRDDHPSPIATHSL